MVNRKKIMSGIVLATVLLMPMTAFAEVQTDEFGIVMDWDATGNGGEDGAGLEETAAITESAVDETYSFEEQADILKQMQEAETTAPTETGLITVTLSNAPDEWSRNNICVTLYRGNVEEKVFLYRQSNWETKEQLPIGHYTVYKVESLDGQTEFHADVNSFDITENNAVTLKLSHGSLETAVILSNADQTELESLAEEAAKLQEEDSPEYMRKLVIANVVPLMLFFAGLYLIWKWNHEHFV